MIFDLLVIFSFHGSCHFSWIVVNSSHQDMTLRAVWGAFINALRDDRFVSRMASSQDQHHVPRFHQFALSNSKQPAPRRKERRTLPLTFHLVESRLHSWVSAVFLFSISVCHMIRWNERLTCAFSCEQIQWCPLPELKTDIVSFWLPLMAKAKGSAEIFYFEGQWAVCWESK